MTLANLPVWSFEPNWESSVTETLAWLTDVMISPTGAEQRRTMRYAPQRTFAFSTALCGEERGLFDNMLLTYGAGNWYLPIWHDATVSASGSTSTMIPCQPPQSLVVGTHIFVGGTTTYDFQITEITAVTSSGITVSPALTRVVPSGTIIHPMTIGRLVEQPQATAMTDDVSVAEIQFLVVIPTNIDPSTHYYLSDFNLTAMLDSDAGVIDINDQYEGFRVLSFEPDWTDGIERGQQRIYDTFDPPVGVPLRNDTAHRPFPTQRYKWVLEGRSNHGIFYGLLQSLRGRAVPVWVPTWMNDFKLILAPSGFTITVARCGFTLSGGPNYEREHIMVEKTDGTRFYARVVNSAVDSSGNEVLLLNVALPSNISPENVLRISFMSLMRLDHDSIEIEHMTDMDGMSEAQVTFRAAPNIRVV